MTEPFSPTVQRRSFTGPSGQTREKKTELWPEPVILATLESSDSLSTTPTSPRAGEHTKDENRIRSATEGRPARKVRASRLLADAKKSNDSASKRTNAALLRWTWIANLKILECRAALASPSKA